jgi:hypothetical protein
MMLLRPNTIFRLTLVGSALGAGPFRIAEQALEYRYLELCKHTAPMSLFVNDSLLMQANNALDYHLNI